ncbi:type I-B CRISPR-associated protein Cas7/Cst2/DevR [Gemmata sp. JC673]|uniref:Type I-B CRISPR-associated protein Cas7/Cst2/DevR n=1 Tax=Gemmata algarum TaxID=2975278 RepID=A0ABU5F480_9BACT|nr:type I-B CRISPR-associated protein Cas7/Cst2/DevR [Gemmata algarum]MDY3562201.1 type I-B CRISPR-associated protein Cas7/Cst2/DevR [Gemmata algarum]
MNLFATVLTYPAPSANYRGESELNRTVIQKVTDGRFDYPIFSPESMRNALREVLRGYGLPSNRERLHDEDQLAVRFADLPDPDQYADDFFFGFLVAAGAADRKKHLATITEKRGKEAAKAFRFKRDSILRMNMAKALEPYRHNAVFTQSPLAAKDGAYQNATTSALLHRETVVAGFQYPFALNLDDCKPKTAWTRKLLKAIGELNDVAGNHARSYFEFAPASVIVRLTQSLVAGYQTYCFKPDGSMPDVLTDILADYYPGQEFYVGGEIVKRGLKPEQLDALRANGVTLDGDPQRLLATVADAALGKE